MGGDGRSTGYLNFSTNDTERMRVDSSGRLLVGTTTATNNLRLDEKFAVVGTSASYPGMAVTGYTGVATDYCPLIELQRSRGTTDGSYTKVESGDCLGKIIFRGADGSAWVNGAFIEAFADGTTGANDMPGRLVFSTTADGASTPTERMKLDRRGQLSLQSTTSTFDVATTQAAGTTYSTIISRHSATNGSPGSGTVSFRVYSNGNVENTNNSYGAISDAKLKENIVDASSQWEDIKDLRVRNYNLIEGQTHTQIGVVAQEVETVSPGLVTESPDLDAEGNDLGTTTKSVNYSVLYIKAVKALQEAMDRIETLENKVAALEAG
jgi:hypothetical protein|tara:strand:- start:18 stop:986 length:969 start_codon:yes stop_codon:yes gene_type:complete